MIPLESIIAGAQEDEVLFYPPINKDFRHGSVSVLLFRESYWLMFRPQLDPLEYLMGLNRGSLDAMYVAEERPAYLNSMYCFFEL